MIVDLGYYSLVLAFFLSLYSICTSLVFVARQSWNLVVSIRRAAIATWVFISIAYFSLTYAFVKSDFSVRFVANNSSKDLPLFYKFTAVWGGMDGSLLLWAFFLSLYGVLILYFHRKKVHDIVPYSMVFFNLILGFLLFLLIGWSNPLARIYPIPSEGLGLNPVLQDPGMIVHPPLLYLGFIGLSIPFSFAMGSLLAKKMNNDWIQISRRWTLVAWLFLTLGMMIGGQWAYYELGWGGYWAWDPVENSSLLPWLGATAFLHSAMVQEKRECLKIWNYILIVITFLLTIIGTFITRSGVLNSVHAFAQSNIGPSFLAFAAATALLCFGLLFYRLPLLEGRNKVISLFCKENSFLVNNILFVGLIFAVFYGTIFPLVSDALVGRKVSVQAPFFQQVSLPIVILIMVLMGITPFLAWNKSNLSKLKKNLLLPAIISIFFMVICGLFLSRQIEFVLLAGVIYFAGHCILLELYKVYTTEKKREAAKKKKQFSFSRRVFGAMIIHLGVVVFCIGILGNFFAKEQSLSFQVNQSLELGNYKVTYTGSDFQQVRNTQQHTAHFQIFKNGKFIQNLKPAKAFYLTSDEPTTEAAILRFWNEDFYISLASINPDDSATVTLYINPLVIFIPLSLLFFALGILCCFCYQSPYFNYRILDEKV
jgi:cytochrome c-type biogenesis protein CcmF